MRRHTAVRAFVALILGGLMTSAAVGQTSLRIGYVDMEYVINNAPQTRAGREKLEEEFKERNEEIVQMENRLEDLQNRLLRDAEIMTDDERENLELLIRTINRDIRRYKDEYTEDFTIRLNEERNLLIKQVDDAVQTLSRTQQLDLVLPDTSVLYASENVDITEKVLERLRTEFENEQRAEGAAD